MHENFSPDSLQQLCQHSNEVLTLLREYQTVFVEKFSHFMARQEKSGSLLFELFFRKELFDSVERVASELAKPAPEIEINNIARFSLPNDETQAVMINVFNHLIRNSLDHGIESSQERQAANKPGKGKITININAHTSNQTLLNYSDDAAV